jgi:hypothetical protein
MRVLEKGPKKKYWSKKLTCTGAGNIGGFCGAKLLVEQGDVFRTEYQHCDGSHESYHTFECVECGGMTDISEWLPFTVPSRKAWLARKSHGIPLDDEK